MERVLLVDDHPLFRQALRTVIKAAKPQLAITEAGTLERARVLLGEAAHFALVLLDLKLPDSEGFSGLLQLRGEFPAVPIAIISTTEDASAINRAIALGAAGYIQSPVRGHRSPRRSMRCCPVKYGRPSRNRPNRCRPWSNPSPRCRPPSCAS